MSILMGVFLLTKKIKVDKDSISMYLLSQTVETDSAQWIHLNNYMQKLSHDGPIPWIMESDSMNNGIYTKWINMELYETKSENDSYNES